MRRVGDHTGWCGGDGSGDVANLRIGDHSITIITILHSHSNTELDISEIKNNKCTCIERLECEESL